MTKEEIIRLVKKTDLLGIIDSQYYDNELWVFDVMEFAKLIAEKERKEWAREFAGMGEWTAVNMLEERGQE